MRVIGLEPTRLAAPDPKSGAAANYATPACDLKRNKSESGNPKSALPTRRGTNYTTSTGSCKKGAQIYR